MPHSNLVARMLRVDIVYDGAQCLAFLVGPILEFFSMHFNVYVFHVLLHFGLYVLYRLVVDAWRYILQEKIQQRIRCNVAYGFFHVFIEVSLDGFDGSSLGVSVKFNSHNYSVKKTQQALAINFA
jgi:hypothetical protein